jgi:hypothetical protein
MKYPLSIIVTAAMIITAGSGRADDPPKSVATNPTDLTLEIAALQTLYQFRFTIVQMEAMRKTAGETAQAIEARPAPKASEGFRKKLLDLRNALVEAKDDENIGKIQEEVDKLRESEKPEIDEGFEMSDTARTKAGEILKKLSARQLNGFLANYGNDFPDPLEKIQDAIDKVRKLEGKDWERLRDEVSEDVGRLVSGLDATKATETGNQVVQLLIATRALKDDEFKTQRGNLQKKAEAIVGNLGPFDVMRHVSEYALAELLSNPRLPAALDARLKK